MSHITADGGRVICTRRMQRVDGRESYRKNGGMMLPPLHWFEGWIKLRSLLWGREKCTYSTVGREGLWSYYDLGGGINDCSWVRSDNILFWWGWEFSNEGQNNSRALYHHETVLKSSRALGTAMTGVSIILNIPAVFTVLQVYFVISES